MSLGPDQARVKLKFREEVLKMHFTTTKIVTGFRNLDRALGKNGRNDGLWTARRWGMDAEIERPDGSRIKVGDILYHPDNLVTADALARWRNDLPALISFFENLPETPENLAALDELLAKLDSLPVLPLG
jgi:hypothetical protein